MKNPAYRYPNIELWEDEPWQGMKSPIDALAQWIGSHDTVRGPFYPHPAGDATVQPGYKPKTNSVDVPETIEKWAKQGMRFTTLEQGCKHWISLVPEEAIRTGRKLKALLILQQEAPLENPWWAMNIMTRNEQLNMLTAQSQDTALFYLIAKGPDADRVFQNIVQEAFVLYPVDLNQVYFDVSAVLHQGVKLRDIPGFVYTAPDGSHPDPDNAVVSFGPTALPVLPVAHRWAGIESLTRGLVMHHAMNKGRFDQEKLIHSQLGASMIESIRVEHSFATVEDEGYAEYWQKMGLQLHIGCTGGRRWISLIPQSALDQKKSLPLIIAMQEVYEGNEHLAVTALSYFYHFTQLAAEGEFSLLFFALEDPDANELLTDILDEAFRLFPVDRRRVYITGHSHDGWFARIFAYRHPDLIAAVATLGNSVGLPMPEDVGNAILGVSDELLEKMRQIDMPLINIDGANEPFADIPRTEEAKALWLKAWERRLEGHRCPALRREEILNALKSGNYVEQKLGIPAERSAVLWHYGFESWQTWIKNEDGREHLSIASTENMPHCVTAPMTDIAWTFLRRFERDPETGAVMERYQY